MNRMYTRLLQGRIRTPAMVQWSCGTRKPIIQSWQGTSLDKSMEQRRYSSSGSVPAGADVGLITNLYQSMACSTPVLQMQQYLIQIHDYTGLPWWASILLSTAIFRTFVTLPLIIYQQKIVARLELIKLEMPAITSKLKRDVSLARAELKWSDIETKVVYNRSIQKEWNKLIVRENCHPAKTLIVLWAQIPLWVCLSMSLRNMVCMLPDPTSVHGQLVFTELTLGGFGWIPNLTEADASFILPVTLGLINLAIIELQTLSRIHTTGRYQRIITNVFRGASLIMVPISCTIPSALNLYWVASSVYGLLQNLILLSPATRRLLRIPKTNSELDHPYTYILSRIKNRKQFATDLTPHSLDGTKSTKTTNKINKF